MEKVANCALCQGTGYVGHDVCSCLLRFRALNRLLGRGFKERLLDLVSGSYQFPSFISGYEFIDYYLRNLEIIEDKGLSLYVFSNERGRGKTTLAHYLMYFIAYSYSDTVKYRRESSLSFRFDYVNTVDLNYKGSTFYVLDDLGAEDKSSPWKREAMRSQLQELLHYRRDNYLPTIITSNYNPSSLSALYDGILDSLLEIDSTGGINGTLLRQVELGGGEDLRLMDNTGWNSEVR